MGIQFELPNEPLLILSLIILAGATGGLVARRLKCPAATGNILAGLALGLTLLRNVEAAELLQPLSTFAMGLISASIGGHLCYRRIYTALRRIVFIATLESVFAVVLIAVAGRMLGFNWPATILLACIAPATSAATTVALVRENRAKGSFVKTLISVVALDNILCIIIFAFAETAVAGHYVGNTTALTFGHALFIALWQLMGSMLIGFSLGAVTKRIIHHPRFHNFSMTFAAILISAGVSRHLGLSPLLAPLFLGMYLGNSTKEAADQLHELDPLEPLLYTCFFTLAGTALHLEMLWHAGLLCVSYVTARIVGQGLGACLGGVLSKCSKRIWTNIPAALIPQAGATIGLAVLLTGDARIPTEISSLVSTVALAGVAINELIGPILTRMALNWAKEAGLDRPRLIEFLQEEFILTDLHAPDKWTAIKTLTDFLVRTHNIPSHERDAIFRTVEERERSVSTGIGNGIAIPHGRIKSGTGIQGVLGICRDGIEFDAIDDEPVRLIVLIVTPEDHEQRHLEVIGSLARIVSHESTRDRLCAALDANDAWEILEYAESRGYNYFLDDGNDNQT